jgi:hypothetical protein
MVKELRKCSPVLNAKTNSRKMKQKLIDMEPEQSCQQWSCFPALNVDRKISKIMRVEKYNLVSNSYIKEWG